MEGSGDSAGVGVLSNVGSNVYSGVDELVSVDSCVCPGLRDITVVGTGVCWVFSLFLTFYRTKRVSVTSIHI